VDALQTVALVVNRLKAGAREIGEQLMKLGQSRGAEMRMTEEHPLPDGFLKNCDAVCVIGGDGTFLGVVPQAVEYGVKVLGVNLGKLGFLVTFSPDSIAREFEKILSGEYETEDRSLLEVIESHGLSRLCLNDAVIKQMSSSRMMVVEVFADGDFVNEYSCDGLIFSTPTGSTAYNLSAGGPILHPNVQGITLTPICPHALSNRSVIFSAKTTVEIRPDFDSCCPQVTLDGHVNFEKQSSFPLKIRVPEKTVTLIHRARYSHFLTMRTKLQWKETSI